MMRQLALFLAILLIAVATVSFLRGALGSVPCVVLFAGSLAMLWWGSRGTATESFEATAADWSQRLGRDSSIDAEAKRRLREAYDLAKPAGRDSPHRGPGL